MSTPKVSVLVLTYNHEKYISKALDSILMQNVNFNYEILIGDDASTDDTVAILKEYRKNYPDKIRLFLNKVNLGATRNAYNIFMNAKGNYLATCEGDDYWTDESKLQLQIDFLESHRDFVGCTHKFTIVDENDIKYRSQYLSWVKQKSRFTLSDFQGMFLPGQPGTFVKRNIVKLYGVDISCMYHFHRDVGDKTLMLLCLKFGDFGFIDKNMSIYRKRYTSKDSVTGKIAKNRAKFLYEDYNMLINFESFTDVDCNLGKKIIFSKALAYWLLTFNREYFRLLKVIYSNYKLPVGLFAYAPIYWVKRVLKII